MTGWSGAGRLKFGGGTAEREMAHIACVHKFTLTSIIHLLVISKLPGVASLTYPSLYTFSMYTPAWLCPKAHARGLPVIAFLSDCRQGSRPSQALQGSHVPQLHTFASRLRLTVFEMGTNVASFQTY
jgi:hypothetical protein